MTEVKTSPGNPGYRSVSQYNQYTKCPYSFYLQRKLRAWQRPAAWLSQGLAVHETAEAIERSGRTMTLEAAQDVYRESYARHTDRLATDTPNLNFWFASGRYRGQEDIERRYLLGLEQVERYLDYYQGPGKDEVIWITPDGTPAIELGFKMQLGEVEVRGFIDQIIDHPEYGIHPRDIKSGNNPGDDFQLGVYAEAARQLADVDVLTGDYWMGRQGKPTVPYKLDYWDTERLTEAFAEMDAGVRAESFEPKPEKSKCMFCSVRTACEFSAF